MHRFFVAPECFQEGELIVRDGPSHQIRDVLHLRPGEIISAMNGKGDEYRVELTQVRGKEVRGLVRDRVDSASEPRTHLVLYQALLKSDRFEWVLQKGTEIGVSQFTPIITSRAVAASIGDAKRARWERIIIEAAEQSGRRKIPALHPVRTYEEALKAAQAGGGLGVIPWEEELVGDIRSLLSSIDASAPVSLFIGPEGGFAGSEIDAARGHGVHPVSLGPRILRADTAGLVAASVILFECGEMDAERKYG